MYFLANKKIPRVSFANRIQLRKNSGNSRVLTSIFSAGDPLDKHPNKVNVSKFLDESLENLDSLHKKGHSHGDIKPSNMVLCECNIYFIDYGSTNPKSITQNIEFPVFTTNLFYPNLHQRGLNYRVPVSDSSTINVQPTGCRQLSWNEHKHSDKYALGLSALWIMHRQQNPNRDSDYSYKFISQFSCISFEDKEKKIDDLTKSDSKLQRQLKHLILDPHFDDANLIQEASVVANKEPVVSIKNTPSKTTANEADLSQDTTVEAVIQDRTFVKKPDNAACVNFEVLLPKKQPDIKKISKKCYSSWFAI
jgi:serine/threonine protein kinase